MPAAGPVSEAAADAVPMFADRSRRYGFVRRVRRYRRMEGGARFFVVSDDGEDFVLDLLFLAPEVVRARFFPAGEEPRTSVVPAGRPRRAVDVSVSLRAGKIVLATAAVELHVVRSPFHFGLFDRRGRLLFVEQIADVGASGVVSFPLGCSRDGRGRVAFHESFALEAGERVFDADGVDRTGSRLVSAPGGRLLFWSSRGVGVFVNHAGEVVWELGCPSAISASFQVKDAYLEYFLIYGPAGEEIRARYAALTSERA